MVRHNRVCRVTLVCPCLGEELSCQVRRGCRDRVRLRGSSRISLLSLPGWVMRLAAPGRSCG